MADSNLFKSLEDRLNKLSSLIAGAREVQYDTEDLLNTLDGMPSPALATAVTASLRDNLTILTAILSNSSDLCLREFFIPSLNCRAAIAYFEGMADLDLISAHIIEKLTAPAPAVQPLPQDIAQYMEDMLITVPGIIKASNMETVVRQLLAGNTALFTDGAAAALTVATSSPEARAISAPDTEADIRGPRDAFNEELRTNITLVRRRLKTPRLVVKKYTIDREGQTEAAVIYLKGIASPALVKELTSRISAVRVDLITSSGSLQSIIEDHPYSPFPTIISTERPDKVVSSLAEGKAAVIVTGTPFVLIAPATLADFFQASDDYYEKWQPQSLIRLTRYIAALISLTIMPLYIAVASFNPGLLPTPLLLTIAASRLGIPFPSLVEALLMEFMLEILQEAGIRLPKNIGPAVSIVGGLVIGEAAVRAGLVSAPMVIIVALAAISSFTMASYRLNASLRLMRVPLMLVAASLGIFGVSVGLIALVIHLSMLESFGIPYLAPFAPKGAENLSDLKDTLLILPNNVVRRRPAFLAQRNIVRQQPQPNNRQ